MKIVELLTKINIMINNEESELLKKFDDTQVILKSKFDEREQIIANQLVSKSVLKRKKNSQGKIEYTKKIR
jgi:hypothetical protein